MKVKEEQKDQLWSAMPEIFEILSESKDIAEGRNKLYNFCKDLEWSYREGLKPLHKLDFGITLEAIKVFINLISLRNEKIAGFSTLQYLWDLAHNKLDEHHKPSIAFLEECRHLFLAMAGKSNIARGWLGPILEKEGIKMIDFQQIKGREAGKARSNYLDNLYQKVEEYINRYPSGLDDSLIAERKENASKIRTYFSASEEDWYDYHWQIKHIIKDKEGLEHLKKLIPLTAEELKSIELALQYQIPFGITPYYLSLFDFSRADRKYDYQVRSQVIPPMHYVRLMGEHRQERNYYFDFMGEHDTSPEELITRRYPMISILKPYDTCPQICVYCQRNWEITGPMLPEGMPTKEKIDKAISWFSDHPAMRDILITGGDPLALDDELIKYIMDRLCSFKHIVNIRWGSRIFVTLPYRITHNLAELLAQYVEPGKRNVAMVTHIESASEVTPDLAEAVGKMRNKGIYVYNQLVYSLETSRRFQNVSTRIAMKKVGVDPYYTFYPKGKIEHKDYLVPVARLWQERKEEARLLPGIFRTDEPVFNVPRLGKNHIRAWQDRELIALTPEGQRVYLWHPWEKGITPQEPYLYQDISIYEYLQELKDRGENIEEYSSIWYYY
jgi:lysine 2,3-aminomutase